MGKDGFYFKMVGVILLFSGFVSCNHTGTKNDQSAESFKIYRLLIDRFYIKKENQPVVINQNSSLPGIPITSMNSIFFSPRINKDILTDFEEVNRIPNKIVADFPVDSQYIFMSLNVGKAHFKDRSKNIQTYYNCMKRLKKLYLDSGGIITFSKIGFNKEMNQGLVTFLITRPGRQHTAGVVFLEKKKGPLPHFWSVEETEIDDFNI
jgi:hypothetical protein